MSPILSPKETENSIIKQHSCRECGMPRMPVYLCRCGGGPSGGGSGGEEVEASAAPKPGMLHPAKNINNDLAVKPPVEEKIADFDFVDALASDDQEALRKFESGLVTVKIDPKNKSLVIETNGGLKDEELAALRICFDKIKEVFKTFSKSIQNFRGELKDNYYSLAITINNKDHFKAFLRELDKHNLLPRPSFSGRKIDEQKETRNKFHPNPLSTRLERIKS